MTKARRSSGWKWKCVAIVIVLGAVFYFSRGYFQRLRKTYPANAFYKVKRADMLISIVEEGGLRALNETVVRSGLEGFNRIIHLAPEGSSVQKGDLLVEFDSSGLKDRLNEQELLYQQRLFQMLQATANLKIQESLGESEIKEGELKVANAESDLEKYQEGDAPLLIKTVESRSGVLAEQVRIASERSARTRELFKTGNATKSEVEADALSLKREQLGLGQYQEDLRLIKKYDQPNQVRLLQSKVEQAKAELGRLKQRVANENAQAAAELKTSQSALEVLEQSLKTQRGRLEKTKIFAPQNGLVVYAPVSPFQFEGSERGGGRRREEGSGEFRGGGKRGGRSNLESSSGNSSRSSAVDSVAAGNQRIASAVSGSSFTDPNGGASGGGNAGAGGDRSGASGGQNASSAAGAFASYPSMRPSSILGVSSATNSTASSSAGSSESSSMSSTGSQSSSFSLPNQFSFRSSSQNYRDFGGSDFYGTPGMLEEGTMVRMRQELIRLPDVSKMLAEVNIEEARVAQIRAGMTAYIQVKSVPGRSFKGTVRRVALLPDAQASWLNPNVKLYPTDILVDEELPSLKPGVSARTEIIITNLLKVLSVPIQTVARLEGENVCFVKKGSRVTPVSVTTGWFNDSFVEITAGLKEGDLVLLAAVGDEDIDDTPAGETNQVNGARDETAQVPPPAGESASEQRRFQRRNDDSTQTNTPPERQRNGPGSGRRPQKAQDAQE